MVIIGCIHAGNLVFWFVGMGSMGVCYTSVYQTEYWGVCVCVCECAHTH